MTQKLKPGSIVRNPRSGVVYVATGKAQLLICKDGTEAVSVAQDLEVIATPALPAGTIVEMRAGHEREIQGEKHPGTGSRKYLFTFGTWDLEDLIQRVIYIPNLAEYIEAHLPKTQQSSDLPIIPGNVADAIEFVRMMKPSEAESLLLDVFASSRNFTDLPIALKHKLIQIRAAIQSQKLTRECYVEALVRGYQRDKTAKDKILEKIQDGALERHTAITTLKLTGVQQMIDLAEALEAALDGK